MQFLQSFSLVISSLVLLYIVYYSFINRKTPGAVAFAILTIATIIWTTGSFFELYAVSLQSKIIWRNIEQIGVFGVPICMVYFALVYTQQQEHMKLVAVAAIPSALSVILIFTNELHHLMRSGYTLENTTAYGESLVVHSSLVGSVLVAYNYSLALVAIIILLNYVRKLSPAYRKQVYILTFCFLYAFSVAFIQKVFLESIGIYLQISVLNTPGAIVMALSLFKHRTFSLFPIARDKVFEVINQGIIVLDENGIVIDANSYALRMMDVYFHIQNPLGSPLDKINLHYPQLNQLITHTKEEQMELRLNDTYISLTFYPLSSGKEKYIGSMIIFNNVTMQKLYEHNLKNEAEKDFLTQLLNKSGFHKALQKYISNGNLQDCSVLMMDIDNFKKINDTFGHASGDAVLCNFTDVINRIIRSEDIACRFGGDEFIIVIPHVAKETACHIAERIRKAVEDNHFVFNNQNMRYTVSMGVADHGAIPCSFDKILEKADNALYQAKSKSKNCSVVFSEQNM